jgi:hypothetical protein
MKNEQNFSPPRREDAEKKRLATNSTKGFRNYSVIGGVLCQLREKSISFSILTSTFVPSVEPEVFSVRMRRVVNGVMASALLQYQFLRR